MAGSRYSKSQHGKKDYCIHCPKHDRIVCWRFHRYTCRELVQSKPTAPPTPSYCEHFCECWEGLFNEAEVACICYGFEEKCKEIGLW